MGNGKIKIIEFENEYAEDFATINFNWLEKYFCIEEYDKKVLTKPKEYVLDKGGQIWFARLNNKTVGTVALIKREEGIFEISKMGVLPDYRGERIGQKLIYTCIGYAVQKGYKRLFLDSSRVLEPAIALYQKVGFREIPVPTDTPYKRCDIRMELFL